MPNCTISAKSLFHPDYTINHLRIVTDITLTSPKGESIQKAWKTSNILKAHPDLRLLPTDDGRQPLYLKIVSLRHYTRAEIDALLDELCEFIS